MGGSRFLLLLGVAIVAALSVAAGTAQATVFAYVANGNVYLQSPDGLLSRTITTAGNGSSPYVLAGIADSGTILAAYGGTKFWYLYNPDGTLRPEGPNIVPMHECGSAAGSIGPIVPVFHPSKSLVAYNYFCNSLSSTEIRLAL